MAKLKITWDRKDDYRGINRCAIWNYPKDGKWSYYLSNTVAYSWSAMMMDHDACIKFVNESKVPVTIPKIGVSVADCNSGGKNFYSFGGGRNSSTGGRGWFHVGLRTMHAGKIYEKYSQIDISTYSGYNMITPGSPTSTADFNPGPLKYFELDDKSVPVYPGEEGYVHLGVTNLSPANTYIKFVLDPEHMDLNVTMANLGYVWRFYSIDGKEPAAWHLVRPVLAYDEDGNWSDLERARFPWA